MPKKILIDGKTHLLKSTKKDLSVLLSIVATLPIDEGYRNVNVRNNALLLATNTAFYGERGYLRFLESKELIAFSKKGTFNKLTGTRTCDLYTIKFYNICNLLVALTLCLGKYLKIPAIKELAKNRHLPYDIRLFFEDYYNQTQSSTIEFAEGKHYEIELVCNTEDDEDSLSELVVA